jgi:hypothetical protein
MGFQPIKTLHDLIVLFQDVGALLGDRLALEERISGCRGSTKSADTDPYYE